jgi:hypothetical protein
MMKAGLTGLIRAEKGQALVLAVILLLIGGLIAAPLLAYMGTGLITGEVYEKRTAELYAADAGWEDAVWKIQSGEVVLCPGQPHYSYNVSDVNGKKIDVVITLVNNTTNSVTYRIESTATGGGSGTTVESYVKFTPGAELNIFSGALASATTITLGKDSTVNGDVYHCGVFDPGNGSTINGTDQGCAPFPDASQNLAFANAFKDDALSGGEPWPATDLKSSTPLGPKYIDGDLTASRDVTITLAGTVYVKGSIRFENTITITGSGSLVAEGDIYFKKLANYTVTGDSIIMSLNGDITLKKSDPDHTLTINALIYAPNGTITFDKDTTVFGGVVGESIVADKEGSFTFVPKTSWDLPGGLPGAYAIQTYSITRS